MKKIMIPPFACGVEKTRDRALERAQGDEPHDAAKEFVRVSSDWTLFADGQPVPVYSVPVTRGGPHSFARLSFEGDEPICFEAVRTDGLSSAELLPQSYNMSCRVEGSSVKFEMNRRGHVTILADGDIAQPLTVSVDPVREEKKPEEINGLYFGPGVHELNVFDFENGQTIYLAAGAVVVAQPHPLEELCVNPKDWAGKPNYRTCLMAQDKKNVSVEGFGILDFSLLDWHERNPLVFRGCENVLVRDVTFVNVPAWTVGIFGCKGVEVDNAKLYGYRENSDGIDIVSTENVFIHDCFIRTGDDAVVVKAMIKPPVVGGKNIECRRCIVWNDKVRCYGICAESVNDISDVLFADCDVIRSYADWTLELGSLVVYICDRAMVKNVVFDDIRIEHECHLATNVMITKDFWSKDVEAGNIRDVVFRNIKVDCEIGSHIAGYGPENTVRGVTYENFVMNGKKAESIADVKIDIGVYADGIIVK